MLQANAACTDLMVNGLDCLSKAKRAKRREIVFPLMHDHYPIICKRTVSKNSVPTSSAAALNRLLLIRRFVFP